MEITLPLDEADEGDIASLRTKLQQADAEIERGEGLEFDEHTTADLADQVHKRGIRKLFGQ